MSRLFALLSLVIAFLLPTTAFAQGLLVHTQPHHHVRLPRPIHWHPPTPRPVPQSTYKIKEISVNAKIEDQIARVQVSQSFVNTGSRQMEVCFVFPLPYDGAIDRLTLMVDGKEFEAKLLEAKQARQIYESIVRKNKDPALLEWIGTGMFKTSVFPVPPGAERTVTLRYSQLLRKYEGLTDLLFPLSTAKYTSHAVEKVDFRLTINSSDKIKNLYSPTHAVEIKRPDDHHAVVTYSKQNEIPSSDFRLFYDVGKEAVGARVISFRPNDQEDGYFVLLASPQIAAPNADRPKKTVVFVVDRSGSMSGKKIEQAKGALRFVLNNLREGDLFNIVAYDSEVESFQPELQKFSETTRKQALGFVEGIYAGGSTNISGALKATLSQLQDTNQPTYIVFLTDGMPTTGETNEQKIVAGAEANNRVGARIFTFGVGYDVNSRLLDKLSLKNRGHSEFVRPNEDIEDRVGKMYTKISAPVMTDVAITVDVEGIRPEDGQAINRVYPRDKVDLFAGEQLVLVGRYKKPGTARVRVSGTIGSEQQKFDFPATLISQSSDESFAFVEKLWAMRRIGEIIDEIDLKGKNDELIKELVGLSTTHGILTRYTSFLADENSNVRDIARNARRANDDLDSLSEVSGRVAVGQRAAKGAYKRADRATPEAAEEAFQLAAPSARSADYAAGGGSSGTGGPRSSGYAAAQPKKEAGSQAGQRLGMLNVGRRSFYRRGNLWVDSRVTEKMEKKVTKVERYSEAYFDLIDKHGKDIAKYLAVEGEVLLELDGLAYSIQ